MTTTLSPVIISCLVIGLVSVSHSVLAFHASCKVDWTFALQCTEVKSKIVNQIKVWTGFENCKNGGEKCGYTLKEDGKTEVKLIHETPVKHYRDDVTFTFSQSEAVCNLHGFSTSEVWYAVLDYGTNYCNMHNLIEGAGLTHDRGYKEKTNNHICTQYSSANCEVY